MITHVSWAHRLVLRAKTDNANLDSNKEKALPRKPRFIITWISCQNTPIFVVQNTLKMEYSSGQMNTNCGQGNTSLLGLKIDA